MLVDQEVLDDWWKQLQRFSKTRFRWPPKVKVMRDDWLPFNVSGRGSPTPMFVIGSRIYVAKTLMSGGEFRGNVFDLATFGHEAFHVQQFHRKGWWWLFRQYIKGMFMSLVNRRILWDHASIPMELEAITVENEIRAWSSKRMYKDIDETLTKVGL